WIGIFIYRRRQWLADKLPRPLLWVLTAMTFSGWLATLAGWYVTEIGRQPFIVYGLLYIALIVAYVSVIKYMAEKPVDDAPTTPQSGSAIAAAASGSAT